MTRVPKKLGLSIVSSTETKNVADDEIFPKCSWFRCFRLVQGNDAKEDILMQDDGSFILLHNNHPCSIGKGSKYINIRCFFVVEKNKEEEIKNSVLSYIRWLHISALSKLN